MSIILHLNSKYLVLFLTMDNFVKIQTFANEAQWIIFRQQQFRMAIINSKKVNCQICRKDDHTMSVHYLDCRNIDCNRVEECPKKLRLYRCLKTLRSHFFEKGTHQSNIDSHVYYGNYINNYKFNLMIIQLINFYRIDK